LFVNLTRIYYMESRTSEAGDGSDVVAGGAWDVAASRSKDFVVKID